MVRKVYSYPGIADGKIQIRAGRALISVPFANGRLDKKNGRNATYVTGDPVMQAIIEKSSMFGSKIFLESTYGTPDAAKVAKKESSKTPDEPIIDEADLSSGVEEYPNVTSFEEAVAVLKAQGVKAVSLRTIASAAKAANALHIVFPNYKFEE